LTTTPGRLDVGLGISGTVSYRYDGVTLVREERALLDVQVAEREGVLRALRAHVACWTQSRSLASTALVQGGVGGEVR
jgi:hypothetical protein